MSKIQQQQENEYTNKKQKQTGLNYKSNLRNHHKQIPLEILYKQQETKRLDLQDQLIKIRYEMSELKACNKKLQNTNAVSLECIDRLKNQLLKAEGIIQSLEVQNSSYLNQDTIKKKRLPMSINNNKIREDLGNKQKQQYTENHAQNLKKISQIQTQIKPKQQHNSLSLLEISSVQQRPTKPRRQFIIQHNLYQLIYKYKQANQLKTQNSFFGSSINKKNKSEKQLLVNLQKYENKNALGQLQNRIEQQNIKIESVEKQLSQRNVQLEELQNLLNKSDQVHKQQKLVSKDNSQINQTEYVAHLQAQLNLYKQKLQSYSLTVKQIKNQSQIMYQVLKAKEQKEKQLQQEIDYLWLVIQQHVPEEIIQNLGVFEDEYEKNTSKYSQQQRQQNIYDQIKQQQQSINQGQLSDKNSEKQSKSRENQCQLTNYNQYQVNQTIQPTVGAIAKQKYSFNLRLGDKINNKKIHFSAKNKNKSKSDSQNQKIQQLPDQQNLKTQEKQQQLMGSYVFSDVSKEKSQTKSRRVIESSKNKCKKVLLQQDNNREDYKKIENENEQLKKLVKQLQDQITKKIDLSEMYFQQFESQKQQLKKKLEKLQIDNMSLYDQLKQYKNKQNRQINCQNGESRRLGVQEEQNIRIIKELRDQIAQLQDNMFVINIYNKDKQSDNKQLLQSISNLQTQLSSLQQNHKKVVQNKDEQLQSMHNCISQLQAEVQCLNVKLEQLQRAVDIKQIEYFASPKAQEIIQKKDLGDSQSVQQPKQNQYESQIQLLQSKIRQLEIQLSDKQKETVKLELRINQQKIEKLKLEQEKEQIQKHKQKLEAKSKQNQEQLQNKLRQTNQKFDIIFNKSSQMQTKICCYQEKEIQISRKNKQLLSQLEQSGSKILLLQEQVGMLQTIIREKMKDNQKNRQVSTFNPQKFYTDKQNQQNKINLHQQHSLLSQQIYHKNLNKKQSPRVSQSVQKVRIDSKILIDKNTPSSKLSRTANNIEESFTPLVSKFSKNFSNTTGKAENYDRLQRLKEEYECKIGQFTPSLGKKKSKRQASKLADNFSNNNYNQKQLKKQQKKLQTMNECLTELKQKLEKTEQQKSQIQGNVRKLSIQLYCAKMNILKGKGSYQQKNQLLQILKPFEGRVKGLVTAVGGYGINLDTTVNRLPNLKTDK